ncbi:hypothetical protein RFI_05861 [Reticulomyxa filosa]|uniref:Uncharacterized protein n=1 Tax=Reticulomyxa filosa TaxID=46433 RepID=X6NZ65_RETFI|nr:hypothetical protein RFI_05861 [Reticulomyxa filosa]|eukprot:ETO31261.1 hypothetical protein RFI_05861 [Reticulomyxa filosa]
MLKNPWQNNKTFGPIINEKQDTKKKIYCGVLGVLSLVIIVALYWNELPNLRHNGVAHSNDEFIFHKNTVAEAYIIKDAPITAQSLSKRATKGSMKTLEADIESTALESQDELFTVTDIVWDIETPVPQAEEWITTAADNLEFDMTKITNAPLQLINELVQTVFNLLYFKECIFCDGMKSSQDEKTEDTEHMGEVLCLKELTIYSECGIKKNNGLLFEPKR